ncbi:MAG: restriction endonuclease subunit S [Candidatus Hydrogenedentes bacterium]|nr:restriction endonuclease subunit S [Candidatus Hydrogenedentota bacterium]
MWNHVPLPKCLVKHKIGRTNQINTADILILGRFPVVDQGQTFIAGYTDDAGRLITEGLPYVIFGDHTRCFKYIDFPFVLGADGTKVLKPNSELFDARFFYYAALALDVPSRGYNRHYTLLKEKSIPRPELDEQRQIAAVLLAVQQAIERQERLIALTAELKKALMHKLFTEGTRGEPQKQTEIGPVPESWTVERLSRHLIAAQYGLSVKGTEDGATPILRMTNQVDGRIVPNNLQMVSIAKSDLLKFKVEPEDVLFNRTNSFELVGRTAIFELSGEYVFASYLIRLRTHTESLRPAFLNHYFNWDATQSRLKGIASRAVSQSNISASRLRGFVVPTPAPDEQDEIIGSINQIDNVHSVRQHQLGVLRGLFRTLLHQLMTAQIRVHDLDLSTLSEIAEPAGVA